MGQIQKNSIFRHSAAYYDLIYRHKDYPSEAIFIEKLLNQYEAPGREVINFACGTGRHDEELTKLGYKITGIDLSENMLNAAKLRNRGLVNYILGDMAKYKTGMKFDCALCLFDSINYLLTDTEIKSFFYNVHTQLKPGGLFIFDSWNGPAVLNSPPKPSLKEFKDGNLWLQRSSNIAHNSISNTVSITYNYKVGDSADSRAQTFDEMHTVRYLFPEEISSLATACKFEILNSMPWFEERRPSEQDWHNCWVLRT